MDAGCLELKDQMERGKKRGKREGLQRAKITSYLSDSEEPSTAEAYKAYTNGWNLNKTTKQQEGQSHQMKHSVLEMGYI